MGKKIKGSELLFEAQLFFYSVSEENIYYELLEICFCCHGSGLLGCHQ
jgi:hypothetical protein